MSPFAMFSRLFARLLRDARLAADLIDVRVPHPELDLNDFWVFRVTAD